MFENQILIIKKRFQHVIAIEFIHKLNFICLIIIDTIPNEVQLLSISYKSKQQKIDELDFLKERKLNIYHMSSFNAASFSRIVDFMPKIQFSTELSNFFLFYMTMRQDNSILRGRLKIFTVWQSFFFKFKTCFSPVIHLHQPSSNCSLTKVYPVDFQELHL